MALIQAYNPAQGGSGTTLAWARDVVNETEPFSSGYQIPLSETPVDENSIDVWSQGQPLSPDDWDYNSGANAIEILFSADPATDAPDGVWQFIVKYPYET